MSDKKSPGNVTLASLAETKAFAYELAENLKAPMLIGLSGELGSGKTTLIRYICQALGVQDQVASPTFVLQHEYTTSGLLKIEHWDLYRLSSLPSELEEECPSDTIRMIEWIEKAPVLAKRADLQITLSIPAQSTKKGATETRLVIFSH